MHFLFTQMDAIALKQFSAIASIQQGEKGLYLFRVALTHAWNGVKSDFSCSVDMIF